VAARLDAARAGWPVHCLVHGRPLAAPAELPHKIVLALFGLAFFAALVSIIRVRSPSREEAIRRVEGVSGIKHRPASSYEDTLTLGAEMPAPPRSGGCTAHVLPRCCESCGRPSGPAYRSARPFALRALLLLSVFVLTIIVGDAAPPDRWLRPSASDQLG
jgi:hypothetical protein